MSDWSWEKLNSINSEESVTNSHEYSDRNIKRDNNKFAKPSVCVVRVEEVEQDVDNSRQNDEPFDDKDAAKVEAGKHGPEIGKNFDNSSESNVEPDRLIVVELAVGGDKIAETDNGPDTSHKNDSDSDWVELKQWRIRMMALGSWQFASCHDFVVLLNLFFIVKLLFQRIYSDRIWIY